jgi:hypothetical protein
VISGNNTTGNARVHRRVDSLVKTGVPAFLLATPLRAYTLTHSKMGKFQLKEIDRCDHDRSRDARHRRRSFFSVSSFFVSSRTGTERYVFLNRVNNDVRDSLCGKICHLQDVIYRLIFKSVAVLRAKER